MEAIDHLTSLPATHTDNGILARVPSQFIAQAGRTLPDPSCAIEEQMQVEIEADWLGLVRLTFIRRRYSRPRAKTSYYAWHCLHAEHASPLPSNEAEATAEKGNPLQGGLGTRDALTHAGLLREEKSGLLGRVGTSVEQLA